MTDSPAFLTRPPNIAHSAWMHGTLWNAIFASLIASEIDVIDTLHFNNDLDYLYPLATVLEMRLNHEYWCEPECTWQTNSINKTATSWQLGFQTLERYWASFQVTRLLQCNQFFQSGRLLEWRVFHFFIFFGGWWWGGGGVGGVGVGVGGGWGWGGGGGVLSSNAFTIWCCIPISRPPRVIRRFKRRSCFSVIWNLTAIIFRYNLVFTILVLQSFAQAAIAQLLWSVKIFSDNFVIRCIWRKTKLL